MTKSKFRAFDFLGNVAIVNFPRNFKLKEKKKYAQSLLKKHKSIKTVLEKQGKVKGRLRKILTKYIAGEKTKEVLYKENNCIFRFNIEKTFFSPRLSNERKEIAKEIKEGEEVLVMFAGIAPYSIIIAKNSKAKRVYSNEINREANKYAKLNAELNNVKNKVEFVNGDIKRISPKLRKENKKFSVIVMPRPQLKDSFLKEAFMLSRKNTKVYYYDFCKADEIEKVIEKIKNEAKKYKKKIKILRTKKAGDIGPYKFRVRVDFRVL